VPRSLGPGLPRARGSLDLPASSTETARARRAAAPRAGRSAVPRTG